MAENTKIEWAQHTFNPWVGCQRVSPGCEHCYAEAWAKRTGNDVWANKPRRRTKTWDTVRKWNREAARRPVGGPRPGVFCASLADVFEDRDELLPWRADLWELVEACPDLTWLVLTKRPENIARMVPRAWLAGEWPAHVWPGCTVEDQKHADKRLPHLLAVPAAVRWVSYEPALGPVDFQEFLGNRECVNCCRRHLGGIPGARPCPHCYAESEADVYDVMPGIHQIVVGGESGPGARAFSIEWARATVDQCRAAGVACFVKQLGSTPVFGDGGDYGPLQDKKGGDMSEWPSDLRIRQYPTGGGA